MGEITTKPFPEQLAELPCPRCKLHPGKLRFRYYFAEDPVQTPGCPDCKGTGKRHPQLWQKCIHRCPAGYELPCRCHEPTDRPFNCPECGGSGWVMDVTEAKLWAFLANMNTPQHIKFVNTLLRCNPKFDAEYSFLAPDFILWWGSLTEAERIEALSEAVLKAEREE